MGNEQSEPAKCAVARLPGRQSNGTHRGVHSGNPPQKPVQPQHPVAEQPGIMERIRATVGTRRLEDVVAFAPNEKVLGKGTFGTVWRGRLKTCGQKVAVKIIEKNKLKQLKVNQSIVGTECEMMRECTGRENFVQLYDIIETETRFCLIQELCDGGNVQDGAMVTEGTLGETQVRFLMKQMLESISWLHSKNICHRDIKPHNYLLVGDIRSQAVKVKLGDFGTALRLERGKLLNDQVGTPAFMAPEIHLLPNKSSGYDHKVDVWAVGVCMIFLLANEYPFIDGQGRLLRNNIVKGDVPLWEANAFQNLFQGAQEVLGMRKKRPSKTARDLTRQLLAPRRQDRLSAAAALRHDWFTKPIQESTVAGLEDVTDNLPMLDMKDFEDAFSHMEKNAGLAMDFLSKVQIGSVAEVPHFDPSDDRLTSCVVCYNAADKFSYVCPQCYHAVCLQCLQKLPNAKCPHCRHEATDMAIAHKMSQLHAHGSQQSRQLYESAASLAQATSRVPVHIDLNASPPPITVEDAGRRRMCFCCSQPASSTNYISPCCGTTVCFECAKRVLVAKPQCPSCGDFERVAATVPQYIAANEAWASAAQLGDAITRSISDMTRAFSTGSTQSGGNDGRRFSSFSSMSGEDRPSMLLPMSSRSHSKESIGSAGGHVAPSLHHAQFGPQSHICCLCRTGTSMFDHVCPCCRSSCCAACIVTRLPREDLRCPSCNDGPNNAHNMAVIASAHQAKHSWNKFWGNVVETFGGSPAHRNVQMPVTIPSPPDTHGQI